jgi:predicted transcriptional regulator
MDFYSLTAQLDSIHNAKSYEPQDKYESKDRRVRAAVPLLKVIKEHPGISSDKILELTNYLYKRMQENLKYLFDNGYAQSEIIQGAPGKKKRWRITVSGERFLRSN